MSTPSGVPKFAYYTRLKFDQLSTKNISTFYVVEETDGKRRIYLGEHLLTEGYLTSHQSLTNYVTTNTTQTISGVKTFSGATTTGKRFIATGSNTSTHGVVSRGSRANMLYDNVGVTGGLASALIDVDITNGNNQTTRVAKIGIYGSGSGGTNGAPSATYLWFSSVLGNTYNVSPTLKIDSQDRVGIAIAGTGRPTQALDVAGKIRMRTQTAANDGADIVTTKKYVDDKISNIELTPGPQGEQGPAGNDGSPGSPGAAAGFGTPTASVTNNATGTPTVSITATGSNTAKIFDFKFSNLKGAKGEPGTPGTAGADGKGWTGVTYSSSTGKLTFASTDGLGYTTGDIRGAKGDPGKDGLTTKINLNGNSYTQTDGTITLPNYPSIPTIPSIMTPIEGNEGTATTQRTINAANLKSIILNHSPAGSRPASDVKAWAKKSSLAIEDIPTGTTGTTVALGNHTHSQYLTSFTETDPTVPSWAKTAAPSNIRYLKMNANNTITWRTAAQFRGDIGAGTSNLTIGTTSTTAKAGDYQPSYSDITGLAANTVLGNPTSNPGSVDTIPLININALELATTAELTSGLTGKSDTGHKHTTADITALTGLPTTATGSISATDTLNIALRKLQTQISSKTSNTGTVTQVKVGDTPHNPVSGVISLPAYPTPTTYSGSTSITLSGTSFRRAALTGDVTASANSNATTIANNAVKTDKINDNAVTLAKIQNISTGKVLGSTTGGTGGVEELDTIDINDLDLGTGTGTNWTQVWSGSTNLNSYRNSYYSATVPSNSYVGKRIAIEVQYSSGTTHTSKIIFGALGSSSVTTASTSISRGIGWSYFDGTNLRVKTLYASASTGNTTSINVGNLKTLFGTFTGTTIEWSTSHSETLYMKNIWVIE